jgi:hypothetical protein
VTIDDILALCHGLDTTLPDLLHGASPEDLARLGI